MLPILWANVGQLRRDSHHHYVEVVWDVSSAARFSSLTVTDDAVTVQFSGCGVGCSGTGGLAWGCKSAVRILSTGVIGSVGLR
jgi:hypothetical protein